MTPPKVIGTLSPDRQTVRVLCLYCRQEHMHGAAGIIDGSNRHRLPHCAGRPAPSAGYFVDLPPAGQAPRR
jgi:hypothetical protein